MAAARLMDEGRVERIRSQVEPVHVGRALAMVVLGVFYLLGWLAAWVAVGLGWARASVITGWRDVYTGRDTRGRGA